MRRRIDGDPKQFRTINRLLIRGGPMLWLLAIIFVIAWVAGFVTQYAGAMIHLLLVAAGASALMAIIIGKGRAYQ